MDFFNIPSELSKANSPAYKSGLLKLYAKGGFTGRSDYKRSIENDIRVGMYEPGGMQSDPPKSYMLPSRPSQLAPSAREIAGRNTQESTRIVRPQFTAADLSQIQQKEEQRKNLAAVRSMQPATEAMQRKLRIEDANKAQEESLTTSNNWQQLLARQSQAIGDKLDVPFIPNAIDPFYMIGSMASNLGAAPYNMQQGNYGQAAWSVGAPVLTGALAGIGAKSSGQFANNVINPFAGIKTSKQITSPTKFKSEIDWAKWNPDTPKYPELIDEYNAIEESTKKAGTWMRNPDGSVFQGSPEQFIQQQSSNFKKAFPEGFDQTFRGSSYHIPTLIESSNKNYKSIFTANEELADSYSIVDKKNKGYYNPNIPTFEQQLKNIGYKPEVLDELPMSYGKTESGGIYNLAVPKTNNKLSFDAGNKDWADLQNDEIFYKLESAGIRSTADNKNYTAWPRPTSNKSFSTDDLATYLDQSDDLKRIEIKNVNDGGLGDVLIHKHVPGNYAKSLIGNVGFFDMTNPNIYKTILPIGAVGAAATQEYEKGGLQLFGKGGYRVVRTSERKGKTHKVIGPEGKVKYFGDPSMGERSKSKYGKEAFYKRHAKNLKANPYFRAYARATWSEGGIVRDVEPFNLSSY